MTKNANDQQTPEIVLRAVCRIFAYTLYSIQHLADTDLDKAIRDKLDVLVEQAFQESREVLPMESDQSLRLNQMETDVRNEWAFFANQNS